MLPSSNIILSLPFALIVQYLFFASYTRVARVAVSAGSLDPKLCNRWRFDVQACTKGKDPPAVQAFTDDIVCTVGPNTFGRDCYYLQPIVAWPAGLPPAVACPPDASVWNSTITVWRTRQSSPDGTTWSRKWGSETGDLAGKLRVFMTGVIEQEELDCDKGTKRDDCMTIPQWC